MPTPRGPATPADAAALADDAAQARLRGQALALADGTDWSRCDDHAVVEQVAAAQAAGRLPSAAGAGGPTLRSLPAPLPAPAPPAPPPPPAPRPPPPPPAPPEVEKSIRGRFTQTTAKCGDPAFVEADGVNLADPNTTRFALKNATSGAALASASGEMRGQSLRGVDWRPKRPADWAPGASFTFDVNGDGQSNRSENRFAFHEYPAAGPATKTIACRSGRFGWTGRFAIAFARDEITVTVKIKLVNRLGAKPDAATDPLPAIGDPVTAEDKALMKADVEGKLSRKVRLFRTACGYGDACACPKPVIVVVDFVESGEHHAVNLFQGPGRANASNWTRVKTRDNSWAHETGHLLGWYDEYAGGAVGAPPRWKPDEAAHVMKTGLTVPPEYGWDFRDWFDGASGEAWTARN